MSPDAEAPGRDSETSTPAEADPLIGTLIKGAYRIEAPIGQGGMGAVYRARQLSVDRDVVIKMLRRSNDPVLNDLLTKRFKREALATSRLSHPNTISVVDFGETRDGVLFLVLEFLPGRSLSKVLSAERTLTLKRVARITRQVCRSLSEAHEAGIIHRDLKPENVFLCRYPGAHDVVKVMDFGVARLLDPSETNNERITRAGLTVGTPMYIAPEQAMGQEVSPATDLYALGVMLFEMLSGAPPFSAKTGMEMALKHIREPPPECYIDGAPDEITRRWQRLVASLLSKDPRQRPQRASEVAELLEEINTPSRPEPQETGVSGAPAWAVARTPSQGAAPERPPAVQATAGAATAVQGFSDRWTQLAIALLLAAFLGLVVLVVATEDPRGSTQPASPLGATAGTDPSVTRGPGANAPDPTALAPAASVRIHQITITLDSRPSGARVLHGKTEICTTPCQKTIRYTGPPPTLELRRSGYLPAYLKLEAGRASASSIVKLSRAYGD